MYTVVAPLNYLNSPALTFATVTCHGDFKPLWIILTAVLALPLLLALVLKGCSADKLVQPSWHVSADQPPSTSGEQQLDAPFLGSEQTP